MASDIGIEIKIGDSSYRVEVRLDRACAPCVTFANASKLSRLGNDFVLDLIRIDPAEFHMLMSDAKEAIASGGAPELEIQGDVVARVFMGPGTVKNLQAQAGQVLEGVQLQEEAVGQDSKNVQ